MTFHLVYMADPRYGGWVTYTAHLAHALTRMKHAVGIYKIGMKRETQVRDFGRGLRYRNVTLDDVQGLLQRGERVLLVAVGPSYAEQCGALLKAGARLVIHDPTELTDEMQLSLHGAATRVVAIRETNVPTLQQLGCEVTYIPHPYVASPAIYRPVRKWNAVAFSRLDWDKHTEIIAEANANLLPAHRCRIYGAENRLFTKMKVEKVNARWREDFHGAFDVKLYAGMALAACARYAVDLSAIKGDGGGTQYTFLEAWDAGAALVVHKKWITPRGTVQPGKNAFVVETAEQLASLLRSNEYETSAVIEGGRAELDHHAPEVVIPAYAALWGA